MNSAPHVVVVGTGAVGTLYGGWLKTGGANVSFVTRASQVDALRLRGIELRGADGDRALGPVQAAERIEDLPSADILIMTVKLYDLDTAARAAASGLKPGGLVVGLQNGVSAAGMLGEIFDPGQVMTGPVYSACTLLEPGVVAYAGKRRSVVIGVQSGAAPPLAEQLVGFWRTAGVDAEIAEDIGVVLWTKFLGFATNAALTCLTRQAAGIIYHDPDLLALTGRSIREVMAVAASEGVMLRPEAFEATLAILQGFPADVVASMRQDLDAERRLELEGVSGVISRLGRKNGVPTPFHDTAYACLKPYRDGAPKEPMNGR
jgi:2-dehydropantoate 2-reductase